jgi:hypothetical protein
LTSVFLNLVESLPAIAIHSKFFCEVTAHIKYPIRTGLRPSFV